MYFKYKIFDKISDKNIKFDNPVINFKTENNFIKERIKNVFLNAVTEGKILCKNIVITEGIPLQIKEKINNKTKYSYNESAYVIELGKVSTIYFEQEKALIYALSTMEELIDKNECKEGLFLFDCPFVDMRGFHICTPGRKDFEDFKKLINLLSYYKYNTLIVEIGGAMEYERHPLINEKWEEFCKILKEHSGVADKIQHYTYPWSKNAIHPDNGGGSYITKDEMRELISYCKERGIETIPVVPSLSHADYILRAYPELNERKEDNDPDTYCPSNPKTYEVLFDIIDEVCEVFSDSKYLSIGHDEVVTIGICDKCKDKDPIDLFIGDIVKINDYVKSKGKKTLIDCDKFTKLLDEKGNPYIDEKGKLCGGCQGYEKGDSRYVPELYPSISRLPKDIGINHWYWEFGFDDVFKDHKIIYANFCGKYFDDFVERKKENIIGGYSSNWGNNDYNHMCRNIIIYHIIYNAYMFWDENYNKNIKEKLCKKILKELSKSYFKFFLNYDKNKKYIKINHTTDYFIPYRGFLDGDYAEDSIYKIGEYNILYEDETKVTIPVCYGENISNMDISPEDYSNYSLLEVYGSTLPYSKDGKTYYTYITENKFPDKKIKDIKFINNGNHNAKVYTDSIKF